MKIRARWDKWGAWTVYPAHNERSRDLLVGGASIARLYQMRVIKATHIFKRTGLYWRLRIGNEQSSSYFFTRKAALRRLK